MRLTDLYEVRIGFAIDHLLHDQTAHVVASKTDFDDIRYIEKDRFEIYSENFKQPSSFWGIFSGCIETRK